ncbi:BESS motif domain and MADF domain-containing protein [Strongyloides ratti]|uniref:BESS motif domain and MADF domain-containing protein n=1 Tax=Strongyloides ratti TaxID=34506 RepID=A0A090L619_STRRB|nr:BESS motif domain and MADF domain-containing protein [Strongyloides ratti]CEF62964.1 BESS motif domain and MADF domain-containing protein [Strongyloides ratti]
MPDEDSATVKLIETVKLNRCLYDSRDKKYRSSEYKFNLWNDILNEVKKADPNYKGDSRALTKFLDPFMTERDDHKNETEEASYIRQRIKTDPKFYEKLINEVKKYSSLYDSNDPNYRHTNLRIGIWKNILESLDLPGDVSDIYKQWKKIRDRYVREKRKRKQMNSSSDEPSSWGLYGKLTWMDSFIEERSDSKAKKEHLQLPDISGEGFIQNDFDNFNPGILEDAPSPILNDNNQRQSLDENRAREDPYFSQQIPSNFNNNTTHPESQSPTEPPVNQIEIPQEMMDGDMAYALSVLIDIKSLSYQDKESAKVQILQLIKNSH